MRCSFTEPIYANSCCLNSLLPVASLHFKHLEKSVTVSVWLLLVGTTSEISLIIQWQFPLCFHSIISSVYTDKYI